MCVTVFPMQYKINNMKLSCRKWFIQLSLYPAFVCISISVIPVQFWDFYFVFCQKMLLLAPTDESVIFFKVEQRQYANRCRNCNPNIIPCSRPSLFTEQYLLWADSVNFWNSPAYSLPIALKFGMRSHKITARGAANEETFVKWQHFRFRELETFQNLIVIYSPLGEEAHEPHKSWLRWCHGIPHPREPVTNVSEEML